MFDKELTAGLKQQKKALELIEEKFAKIRDTVFENEERNMELLETFSGKLLEGPLMYLKLDPPIFRKTQLFTSGHCEHDENQMKQFPAEEYLESLTRDQFETMFVKRVDVETDNDVITNLKVTLDNGS